LIRELRCAIAPDKNVDDNTFQSVLNQLQKEKQWCLARELPHYLTRTAAQLRAMLRDVSQASLKAEKAKSTPAWLDEVLNLAVDGDDEKGEDLEEEGEEEEGEEDEEEDEEEEGDQQKRDSEQDTEVQDEAADHKPKPRAKEKQKGKKPKAPTVEPKAKAEGAAPKATPKGKASGNAKPAAATAKPLLIPRWDEELKVGFAE
jgi:outer membrane biosynthesis protein TonB